MEDFRSNKNDPNGRLTEYVEYRDTKITNNIDSLKSCIKYNYETNKVNTNSTFRDDVLCYYDFSIKENIGYDFSSYQNHLSNPYGVVQVIDTRTSAKFNINPYTSANTITANAMCLFNDNMAKILAIPEFSIAFWLKEEAPGDDSDEQVILECNDPFGNENRRIRIGHNSVNNVVTILVATPLNATTLAVVGGASHVEYKHFCFTITPTTIKIYVNGVLSNTTAINVNMAGANFTSFTLGGSRENLTTPALLNQRGRRVFRTLDCYLGDFIMFNRVLSIEEINEIYNDNYGYSCIVFAGQSNMVGSLQISNAGPLDYSYFKNVYQYEIHNNIDEINLVYLDHIISKVTTGLYNIDGFSSQLGPFFTFIQDYVKYMNLPSKRRILCLSTGRGATGFRTGDASHLVGTGVIYKYTVLALNDCVQNNFMNTIQAFLWHQGENDAVVAGLSYQKDFDDMIGGFKNEITGFTDKVPIITGQIASHAHQGTFVGSISVFKYINEIFANMALTRPNYGFVKTHDLYLHDGAHFDIPSVLILGRRYFDEYLNALKLESPKPLKQQIVVCPNQNVQIESDLKLKPINKKDWVDLPLSGFGTRTLTLPCTLVHTGNAVFKIVKLGSLVILTLKDNIEFTAGSSANIRIVAGGLPNELLPIENSITVSKGLKETSLVFIDWEFLQTGEINVKPSEEATFENTSAYTLYPFTMVYESVSTF